MTDNYESIQKNFKDKPKVWPLINFFLGKLGIPYSCSSSEWSAVCSILYDKLKYPPCEFFTSPQTYDEVRRIRRKIDEIDAWAKTLQDRRLYATYRKWLRHWERACSRAIKAEEKRKKDQAVARSIPRP